MYNEPIRNGVSKMQNVNPQNIPFKIAHDDHGISDSQAEYIHSQVCATEPTGFFIQEVIIPEHLGDVENGLYGTCEGDKPVAEADVVYIQRGERNWKDRMVNWPKRRTSKVQAIGIMQYDEETSVNHILYFTIYGGSYAPQHPEDPNNRDVEGSTKFWSEHALCM